MTPPLDILLVDDNPTDVLYTTLVFEDAGLAGGLHVVRDGVEALAFLRREGDYAAAPRPALVLLDLNMPRLGGLEVLSQLRGDETLRDLFVVVLTATVSEVEVWRARDIGASAYLPKPIDPAEALALLAADRAP